MERGQVIPWQTMHVLDSELCSSSFFVKFRLMNAKKYMLVAVAIANLKKNLPAPLWNKEFVKKLRNRWA